MVQLAAQAKLLFGDRFQWMAILIVTCFVCVLLLRSQSAASYPTYFLALVMMATFPHWRDVFKLNLMRWVLALLIWLCLSALWSDPFNWRDAFSVCTRALLVFSFVVAVAECQLRGQLQRWMSSALTVVGAVAVLAAIANFYASNPADGRLNGLGQLDTHVIAALVYGVVLLFAMRTVQDSGPAVQRVAAMLVVGLVLAAVFLSDSRNAWVSVTFGFGVFVLAHRGFDSKQFVTTVASMGLIVVIALGLLVANETTREVMLPRGDSFRLTIWTHSLDQILADSLLFGRGILTVDNIITGGVVFTHPHNLYLALLHQGGLIALGLYAVVVYKTLDSLLRRYENKDAKLAMSIFALALSAHLLDGHELIDKVGDTWFLIWLPLGIALGLNWRPSHYP